jgi:prolipoprotein diacylglyceryltransferase
MTNSLSAASYPIYAVLAMAVLYLLIRHGRHGFLGWLFLLIFCIFRIIGGVVAVRDTGTAANIISSVGLSPLLLATAGILHEA